ncbi:hypothetical protein HAQ06_27490, partial [Pseudomonas sp. C2L12B]|nr:hypothetical protein [Pseudomonas typographi]
MSEQAKSLQVVTILPPPNQHPGRVQLVMGTKVILSDGSEFAGVTAVSLKAAAGGVWEATISVLPQIIQPVVANAEVVEIDVT